jgi:transposase-like protein
MAAVTCPRCGSTETYRVEEGRRVGTTRWECGSCGKAFSVRIPTELSRLILLSMQSRCAFGLSGIGLSGIVGKHPIPPCGHFG